MKNLERIESNANAKIKLVAKLHAHKYRKEESLLVAEGVRLVEMALAARWPMRFAFVSDNALKNPRVVKAVELLQDRECPVYQLDGDLYSKASDTVNGQGLLLVMGQRLFTWQEVLSCPRGDAPLLAVLDGIQDPGNAGTIIRTADWFGIEEIICSQDTVDCWNPKVVQATMGALARVHVHYINLYSFILNVLQSNQDGNNYPIYGTLLDGKNMYSPDAIPSKQRGIIIMGNEGNGISSAIRSLITHPLYIPSFPAERPTSESLNVGIATAIILAEFRR